MGVYELTFQKKQKIEPENKKRKNYHQASFRRPSRFSKLWFNYSHLTAEHLLLITNCLNQNAEH